MTGPCSDETQSFHNREQVLLRVLEDPGTLPHSRNFTRFWDPLTAEPKHTSQSSDQDFGRYVQMCVQSLLNVCGEPAWPPDVSPSTRLSSPEEKPQVHRSVTTGAEHLLSGPRVSRSFRMSNLSVTTATLGWGGGLNTPERCV